MANVIEFLRNEANALVGNKQTFGELMAAGDISRAIRYMEDNSALSALALSEYNVETHKINRREYKIIFDKKGNRVRMQEQWKIPFPIQRKINEIATAFLFGQPPMITQQSKGTDKMFDFVKEVMNETRFNARLKECKRMAGSERQCAKLYYLYKDSKTGNVELKAKILSYSKGDDIRPMRDVNNHMVAFGHGYSINTAGGVERYFDIYSPEVIYRCKKSALGWETKAEKNVMGVIPVVLYEQEIEWAGTEKIIDRIEYILSTTADINDYFASPAVVTTPKTIERMPEKDAVGKLFVADDPNTVKYLTWDSMPESKRQEYLTLKELLFSMTSTPDISFDNVKGLGNIPSGRAFEFFFMDALFKAKNRQDEWRVYIERDIKVISAIIGNVLDISLKEQAKKLRVNVVFQSPLMDDVSSQLKDLCTAVDAKIMSVESAIERNPLVKDHKREIKRLADEEEERNKRDAFETAE